MAKSRDRHHVLHKRSQRERGIAITGGFRDRPRRTQSRHHLRLSPAGLGPERARDYAPGHTRLCTFPVLLLKGEELPVALDPLQLVPAPALELDVRAEQKVADRAGHEHLTGRGAGQDAGGDVDGNP